MSGAFRKIVKSTCRKYYNLQILAKRSNTTKSSPTPPTPSTPSSPSKDVPGLSKKIVDVPSNTDVGPGASKKSVYKNPEYFCYNNTSYFEAEVEMLKYRLPQPSNKSVPNK